MGAYFRGGLFLEGVLRFKMGWVDNKNSLEHYENSLKQLKTASTNSLWAYIREGLLSEGLLRLRFGGGGLFSGGLIFH